MLKSSMSTWNKPKSSERREPHASSWGMVVHAFNPGTQEVDAGGSL